MHLMFFSIHSGAVDFDCNDTSERLSCVEYVRNHDGDTITFNIRQVHPLLGREIGVRILGVQTGEMSASGRCERQMAERARAEVEKLMLKADRIDLVEARRDKYFRVVADVIYDGRSLREYLLKRNLAVPYDGGTKPDVDWCDLR